MSVPKETLSEKAATRQRYIHEYVEACTPTQVLDHAQRAGSQFWIGGDPDGREAIEYPAHKLEEHINMRAYKGWKLVFMEPHWHYHSSYNHDVGFLKPLAIVGWYLTFERTG